jgi:hypothetical protein
MHARHEATHVVDKTNGYSWDYSKLLCCPSRLRLFIARVGRVGLRSMVERRNDLWATLKSLADLYQELWTGPLAAVVLAQAKQERAQSQIGMWAAGALVRSPLFP